MKVVHPGPGCEAVVTTLTSPDRQTRMNVHKCPYDPSRSRPSGPTRPSGALRVADAAEAADISTRTAYKWLARHRAGGEWMLHDRSSAPARRRHATDADRVAPVERLRRQRMSGPAIARRLPMPRSTVGTILRRLGLGKLSALEEKPPVRRYQRERPANSSPSTPRSSAASTASATASPATAGASRTSVAPGGRCCTWPSTTPRALPTPRC